MGADEMGSHREVGHYEKTFSDTWNNPASIKGRDGSSLEQVNGSLPLILGPAVGAMNGAR